MRTPSLKTMKAAIAMEDYYCNVAARCLPRGSYKLIAKELNIDERIVSKNARLRTGAHVHHNNDDDGNWDVFCWICGGR